MSKTKTAPTTVSGGKGLAAARDKWRSRFIKFILWPTEVFLLGVAGATMSLTIIGAGAGAVFLFFAGITEAIGFPASHALVVLTALATVWIVLDVCWDWEVDWGAWFCLMFTCSAGLNAVGPMQRFTAWWAGNGEWIGAQTIGRLFPGGGGGALLAYSMFFLSILAWVMVYVWKARHKGKAEAA